MIGILTEKPSARRNFAKALGGMTGTYNGEQYTIVSARGHLYEFSEPSKQVAPALSEQYRSWDLKNLPWNEKDFMWKREKKKDTSGVLKDIKSVLSKCSEVVIATDVDPTGEGELLAWEILDELNIAPRRFSRMYFTDEAPKSIQKAFKDRKVIPSMSGDMDYVKADYRSKFDFMSMQFTRIATAYGDGHSVLRQGRLKSAMVQIVGDALKAVANYKKIPYYQNRFRDENGVVYISDKEPRFPKKEEVPKSYTSSSVIVDSRTMKTQAPPRLIDLATLSSQLSAKGVKAKQVLEVYQKMYESQIVSYPRTEDKVITPEQFNELLPLVDKIAKVVGIDPRILTHRTPRKTHVKTGGAHGANRPGPNVPVDLDSLKKFGACAPMIYEILARNYLATLCEDYEYEAQKGHLQKYPDFKGSANVPKKLGYKAVFSDVDDVDDLSNAKGLGTNASPFIHEGFPPKPPYPTMKWLMKQLEKHDVGTGATRTSIYADVTSEKSKYPLLIEKKGRLSMSQYGDMSYVLLKDTNIGNLSITEQLMSDMRQIAAGNLNPDACLHKMQQLVVEDIKIMKRNSADVRKELGVMEHTVQKEKYTGVWAKTGQEVSFSREWGGHRFTDDECEDLLAGKDVEIHGLVSKKTGNTYGVVGKLSEQTFKGDDGKKHKFIGFERMGFAQAKTPPKSWSGHTFTDDELLMLEQGMSVSLDDCKSKKTGRTFSCKVTFGARDDGSMGIIPDFGR